MAVAIPECIQRNQDLLNEAKRILTDEANTDQALSNRWTQLTSVLTSVDLCWPLVFRFGSKWSRTPSAELTKPLWTDINKYDSILQKAMNADDTGESLFDYS